MKQTISNLKIDNSTKKRKRQNLISEIPIKYIILNKATVIKPIEKFIQLNLFSISFSINENPSSVNNNSSKLIPVKDIQLLSYSSRNSLFCLTLNGRCYNKLFSSALGKELLENSIWFCIDIVDIFKYKTTYQEVIRIYRGSFPVEPLSDDNYTNFTKIMCKKRLKNEFVNDWSYYISPTLKPSTKSPKKISKLNISMDNLDITQCSSDDNENIEDYDCLKSESCLNDKTINFYLMHIYNEMLSEEDKSRSYFFNLFFNTKLIGTDAEQQNDTAETRHVRVSKWTKNVDIFSKDFIIIPIIEDTHWFLVIVCFPWMVGMIDYCKLYDTKRPNCVSSIPKNETGFATEFRVKKLESLKEKMSINPMPCILVFDSFTIGKIGSRTSKVKIIREYLKSEWDSKRAYTDGPLAFDRRTCRGYIPKVPQQKNLTDCGIFLLLYVEYFFKVPVVDFSLNYFKFDLFQWFTRNDANRKRHQLKELIIKK